MSSADPTKTGLTEVRYSLPEMLREVQLERSASVFAMEKLDRTEIAKLFQKNRPRRALKTAK
jgi:sulfur relay (sulfurtransferase) DsrF/TusC family protein